MATRRRLLPLGATTSTNSMRAIRCVPTMFFMEWVRHAGDSRWHAVSTVEFNGSTITRCRGRWPSGDNETLVESSHSPPDEERCKACSDVLRKYAAFDLSTVDP